MKSTNAKLKTNNNNNEVYVTPSSVEIPTAAVSVEAVSLENEENGLSNDGYDTDDYSSGGAAVSSYNGISFHNEQLIQEIIMLPNQNVSDDDAASSDNCIYAYRGRGNDSPEPPPPVNNDDETDFLEMDFDPEPNSELENLNEIDFMHIKPNYFNLSEGYSLPPPQQPSTSSVAIASAARKTSNSPSTQSPERFEMIATAAHGSNIVDGTEKKANIVYTGARPKNNRLSSAMPSSIYSSTQGDALTKPVNGDVNAHNDLMTASDHQHCLDCTELEFIRQTKPDTKLESLRCSLHSKAKHSKKVDDINLFSSLSVHDSSAAPTTTNKKLEYMVTIYSVNCDYTAIMEAAKIIGVTMNTELLKQYFESNLTDEDTTSMSIPEYLLYTSKRNCNYKKIVELIKAACLDFIDVHFYPVRWQLYNIDCYGSSGVQRRSKVK